MMRRLRMMTRQADDLCCSYFVFEARLRCRCRCRQLVSFRLGEVFPLCTKSCFVLHWHCLEFPPLLAGCCFCFVLLRTQHFGREPTEPKLLLLLLLLLSYVSLWSLSCPFVTLTPWGCVKMMSLRMTDDGADEERWRLR